MYEGRYDCPDMMVQSGVWKDVANAEASDEVIIVT
jgi:hypothetical protein